MRLSYDIEPIVSQLSQKLNIDLDTKHSNAIALLLDQKYRIQIEFLDDRILFSSIIGEILPSRFRSQVFEDALRANLHSTGFGALGYDDREKNLVLILNYPIIPPKESDFFNLLDGFILKMKVWKDALESSNTRLLS